jgi:ferric enterobactin receptor
MKKYLLLVNLLMAFVYVQAQFPGGGGSMPEIGHLYGKIVDSATGKALSDVSVLFMQSKFDTATKKRKDLLFKGTSTAGNGEFSMAELPIMGPNYLQVSAVGYKPVKLGNWLV